MTTSDPDNDEQPPQRADSTLFGIVSSTSPTNERDLAVLRSLGRFEFMHFSWLKTLHYPDLVASTAYRNLARLEAESLIWRIPGPVPGRTVRTIQAPKVYGLTTEGLTHLASVDAEPDQGTLDRLSARDRRNLKVGRTTLSHDLQAAWWCAMLITDVRKSRRLRDIYLQVEYTTTNQRLDALLILRFWKAMPKNPEPPAPWSIPWWNTVDVHHDHLVSLAFALEIDRGTEPLKILLAKAVTYRDLTVSQGYHKQIGMPVIPLFLVPTPRRGGQIMTEWKDAWPDNPGIITLPHGAVHPTWGAVWGQYRRMCDGKPTTLLGSIGCPTVDVWKQQWL